MKHKIIGLAIIYSLALIWAGYTDLNHIPVRLMDVIIMIQILRVTHKLADT